MKTLSLSLSLLTMLFITTFVSAQDKMQSCDPKCTQMSQTSTDSGKHGMKFTAIKNKSGKQVASITIKDGYHPDTIVVKRGVPVTLKFSLQEKSCTGTVVMKAFGINKKLKQDAVTNVNFTPNKAGSYSFSCPMEMIHGTIVVED